MEARRHHAEFEHARSYGSQSRVSRLRRTRFCAFGFASRYRLARPCSGRARGRLPDSIAPRLAVAAILAALDYRDRTGVGQYIDLSQVECAISTFMSADVLDYTVNGRVTGRMGTVPPSAPHGSFPLRRRLLARSRRRNGRAMDRPSQGYGQPGMGALRTLRDHAARLANVDDLEAQITDWTRTQSVHELVERLQAKRIPAAVVLQIDRPL